MEVFRTYAIGHAKISQSQLREIVAGEERWATHYYLYDGQGSVIALADESGTITDAYTYDAYGIHLREEGQGTPNSYRYTGEQWDADLAHYYLRARYYEPKRGRFWTMDPFEGFMTDPQSLHKYLYAHANPVMFVDPSGNMALVDVAIALHVRVIAFGARWNAYAFATGGAVLSRYFQTLGRFSERVVNIFLAGSQRIQMLKSARIDHLFRVGKEVVAIETKYSASRRGSEGFTRLISQVNHMLSHRVSIK